MRARLRSLIDRIRKPKPTAIIATALSEAKHLENDLQREHRRLQDQREINRALVDIADDKQARDAQRFEQHQRYIAEIVEANAMCGAGPWQVGAEIGGAAPTVRLPVRLAESLGLKEAGPVGDVSPLGAYGMYELLLQNVNWQREINYSWLEFTRWGIQQIILICRLYWIKNPIVRRLVNVRAEYVFARGFDVTTDDETANDAIQDFIRRNQKVLGHVALTAQQRSKDTDGNLFWVFFPDKATGECDIRTIDATEIQDIWTDPDDADVPQYYQRIWTQRAHDAVSASQATTTMQAWYPAIDYEPTVKPESIKGYPVMWDAPVYHRKIGTVGKWLFGCPPVYPMVDWAKESRRFLEACASVRQSLSQFATKISTKGGQQAIEGIKQQLETQVGPGSPIYDTNPPAVAGATWVSGPGTSMDAFKVQGATFSPEDVRRYVLMCCATVGMPETFLGDVSTGNLATAMSLDRPTETVFLSIQEEWIEDLTVIVGFMLKRSLTAPSGKLREAAALPGDVRIIAAPRQIKSTQTGARHWVFREASKKAATDIEVRVNFPAIREGDMAALVKAGVEAMTLDNKGGQIVGVDEKTGVLWLMQQLGIENAEELVEKMYPSTGKDKYDPDRTKEVLPPPIPKTPPVPGVQPTPADVQATMATATQNQNQQTPAPKVKEAFARLANAIEAHIGD
jgi:hypothetical protein